MKFPIIYNSKTFLDDAVVLINTCDKNADVLTLLLRSFDKYWKDNPFPVVVNTESNEIIRSQFNDKEIGWGERLLSILKSLKCKFVILTLDDYILEAKIDTEMIYKAMAVLHDNIDASVFYLDYCTTKEKVSGDFYELGEENNARVNSHPAVWRREDLILLTENYDTPWSWESFGSYRARNSSKRFYSVSSKEGDIYKYDYRLGGAVYRGKWVKEVVAPLIDDYKDEVDFHQRGFVGLNDVSKRTLKWKVSFLLLGYRTMGFHIFKYVFNHIKKTRK